jgi:hypothetical protein
MNQIVRWSAGRIEVRPGTGEDELAEDAILRTLVGQYPTDARGFWESFARLCVHTEASEGLTFQPERVRALPDGEVKSAYEAFLKVPSTIRRKWDSAIDLANAAVDVVVGPWPLPEDADPKA